VFTKSTTTGILKLILAEQVDEFALNADHSNRSWARAKLQFL